jgi:Fic family protein
MSWRPDHPYNDLPLLPPAVDLETRAILKACIEARAALSGLNQAARRITNQSVLINTIPLLEAQGSTEIENIVTTTDKLFQYADAQSGADSATREALRYRTALHNGFKAIKSRPLNTNTAVEICRTIKNVQLDIRKVPGTALANDRTGDIVYTPPEGEQTIRNLLANWEQFLHGETVLDPLIRMATGHYQFEAIHPFTDGNGRTGRVLNLLFLIQEGLLDLPILYLSRYIIAHKTDYYRLLNKVTREHAWEDWILYMLQAVEETGNWLIAKIDAIATLERYTVDFVSAVLPKIYSRELVEVLFEQPYCRISNLVERDIAKRQSASKYLKALAEVGVVEEQSHGRERLFIHTKYLKLLQDDSNAICEYDISIQF